MLAEGNLDTQQRMKLFVGSFSMSAKCIYSPSLWEDPDNTDVSLREVELWQYVPELDIKRQGPTIYLPLPCKIHEACINICVIIKS